MGGLLNLATQVMAVLPEIHLESTPRMADFAQVLAAIDRLEGSEGLQRYTENRWASAKDSLQSDAFIAALVDQVGGAFEGTSADLLKQVMCPDGLAPREWPPDGRRVTALLRANAPALRLGGWTIAHDAAKNRAKVLRWTIEPPERT